MNRWTPTVKYICAMLLAAVTLIVCNDVWISWVTHNNVYYQVDTVPTKPIAIVLGTSPKYYGRTNHFYDARIMTAAQLYHAGKVKGILVSGDNSTKYYNEPIQMQRDLMAQGVPGEHITLDYAGFRTLDSILRADLVFDIKHAIVISQAFHIERAIWISQHYQLDYVGLVAPNPPGWNVFWRVRQREVIARFYAIFEVLLGKEPKFLGPKETVKYPVDILQGEQP